MESPGSSKKRKRGWDRKTRDYKKKGLDKGEWDVFVFDFFLVVFFFF